ncbi:MAG: DUF6427 family protein [Flavobacteriaceae bacterium]|nr:DUF6427 family protein [Flavobacteriaceae bacterium]
MFRLLSKETNIFSIPTYVGVLLAIMLFINVFHISFLSIFSSIFAFLGLTFGYILFNKMALNRQSHLPLFLYTIFILAFYKAPLDIGISITLFANSILLFLLTDDDPRYNENSYFLIGSLLGINFIFLPTMWALVIFVLLHIISVSDHILSNIFKLVFGIGFVFLGYFCLMYFLGMNEINEDYIPLISNDFTSDFSELYFLIPILIFTILAIFDHFLHFNEKSPRSKFKYSFILAFLFAQCLIISFYMGENEEYLLLTTFPISIILSRFLRFLKKSWLQEVGFWIIVISCLYAIKSNLIFTLL